MYVVEMKAKLLSFVSTAKERQIMPSYNYTVFTYYLLVLEFDIRLVLRATGET